MSVLDGITERTTKADLLGRLREAARTISGFEDENAARMQELEERVRSSLKPTTVKTLMVSSSPEEWREAVDFLENFEGYLPSSLARVREGAKEASK